MKTLVIGLGHKARNGKDEAARTIIAERASKGIDVRKIAFADVLKKEISQAIEKVGNVVELFFRLENGPKIEGFEDAPELPDWVEMEADPDMTDPLCPYGKYRTLLQWWGTEYRRHQEPDYWVKKMAETIEREQPEVVLITDLRFPNEAAWIKSVGGVLVKVTRVGYVSSVPEHYSEKALDGFNDWDYVIDAQDNNIDDLRTKALAMFDEEYEWQKLLKQLYDSPEHLQKL